jgi:hypothetical protein
MNIVKLYRNYIREAFDNACNKRSKLTSEILNMDGLSGEFTRHFYNNMLDMLDARYLEIGTWKGSSVCSAMYGNSANVVCIDNWSYSESPKTEFITNFYKYKGTNNAKFIEQDCFSVDVKQLPKFNIYMYDGDHSSESHFNALVHYYDAMDDVFIYIVDDWNDARVREGTMKAIDVLNLDVLYEKDVRLTYDNTHTNAEYGRKTWWNGIYISILRKNIV